MRALFAYRFSLSKPSWIQQIEYFFSGPGISNIDLDDSFEYHDVSSLDMPITVLNALGIKPGRYMRGRILEEIYES